MRSALLMLACALALVGCAGHAEPPPAAPRSATVIWAVGDGGVDARASRQVARLVASDGAAHVLYLGDVYEGGTAAEFRRFRRIFAASVDRMWPTPGNHEWPRRASGYDPFWKLPHRYARSAGGWKLVSANSQTPDSRAQLRWLRRQTAGGGDCRIAFWHRPRFNAGEHRDEQRDVARMWDAVAGRAAIVLSGHDHDMQRFKPVSGTTQYVSGAGGKNHYRVRGGDRRLAFSDSTASGALRIELRPGSADLRFVSTSGTVLDHSTVACRG
jgi:hypothetical protein